MSWLKAVIGGAIGAQALDLVKTYVEKEGGLEAVANKLRSEGFRKQVDSWISTGKNEAITGLEMGQAIGAQKLKNIADSLGVDFDKARELLAEYLPVAIDKASPDGTLPPPGKDEKKSFY